MPPLSHIFILDTISSNRTCKADSPMVKTATSHCIPLFGFRARCPSSLTPIGSSVFWLMEGSKKDFQEEKACFSHVYSYMMYRAESQGSSLYLLASVSLESKVKSSDLSAVDWPILSYSMWPFLTCLNIWHPKFPWEPLETCYALNTIWMNHNWPVFFFL